MTEHDGHGAEETRCEPHPGFRFAEDGSDQEDTGEESADECAQSCCEPHRTRTLAGLEDGSVETRASLSTERAGHGRSVADRTCVATETASPDSDDPQPASEVVVSGPVLVVSIELEVASPPVVSIGPDVASSPVETSSPVDASAVVVELVLVSVAASGAALPGLPQSETQREARRRDRDRLDSVHTLAVAAPPIALPKNQRKALRRREADPDSFCANSCPAVGAATKASRSASSTTAGRSRRRRG